MSTGAVVGDDVTGALLLAKPDIAALARVQRPVVTMWVTRYRHSPHPFPAPVSTAGGVDRYRAVEVVDWIRTRGLGNSDTLTADLALHAVLTLPDALGGGTGLPADTVWTGVTALLSVKTLLGVQLSNLDVDDLLDRADELDPDDEYLYREVAALGNATARLAGYVDLLSDAAYTPAQAFEALMARRFPLGLRALTDATLRPAAVELAARIAVALTTDEGAVFVDPSPDGSDLLVMLRTVLPEYAEPVAMTGRADTPSSRLARRRLAVHQWRLRRAPAGGFAAGFTVAGPATFVTQFPAPGSLELSDAEILAAIDEIAMQMGDGQVAVVVGPAAALVDPLPDREAESIRSALVRSDRLRAVLRLPEGLRVSRPGLATALWVLGSADRSVPPAQRWTVLADLGGVEVDESAIDGVVSDVLAAMGPWTSLRAHAFRFGVVYGAASLLAARSLALPMPRPAPRPRRTPGEVAGRVGQWVVEANEAAARLDPNLRVAVEYHDDEPARTAPAGVLADAHELKVLPGNRIDAADVRDAGGDAGTVPVIGVDEVLGRRGLGSRAVDRLAFTARYPSGRYTEPGDLVFCTGPEFAMIVDTAGSSVVVAPARVLRVRDPAASGLVPELIARHLSTVGIGDRTSGAVRRGKPWRAWEIPRIAPHRVPGVTAVLADLRRRRQAATDLLATLDRVTDTVVDGVGRGALTVTGDTDAHSQKGR